MFQLQLSSCQATMLSVVVYNVCSRVLCARSAHRALQKMFVLRSAAEPFKNSVCREEFCGQVRKSVEIIKSTLNKAKK